MITIEDIKADLRIIHDSDDSLLQILLDAAIDEALRFMNRTELPTNPYDLPEQDSTEDVPSSSDPIVASVYAAIFLSVRAKYEGMDAAQIMGMRGAFEVLLQPYRTQQGV